MELITLLRYFLWSFKASLHAFFASKFPVMSPKIWICSSTILKINVDRKTKRKKKGHHTQRERDLYNVIQTLGLLQESLVLGCKDACNKKNSKRTVLVLISSLHIFSLKFPTLLQHLAICVLCRTFICRSTWLLIWWENVWVVFHGPHQLKSNFVWSKDKPINRKY